MSTKNDKKKIYYPLRIVAPDFSNIYTNHGHYELEYWVGAPNRGKEKGLVYTSHLIECDICGVLIHFDKAIVVKYGTANYMRRVFCLNCFHAYFPWWRQWLLNHSDWYSKRFIARYFHVCPNWFNITLNSEIFFGKSWFPNVPICSPYNEDNIAKNFKEFEKKIKVHHDWAFANEIKEREDR
jgi:hypothetical protein